VPLHTLDVPSVAGEDAFLATLREGPDAYGRVVTGCSKAFVVRRETETPHGLAMRGPRGEVVHVGLKVLDDSGLVGRGDVGAGVIECERTDGGVVRLQDGLKVERQPVPSCELPTRGTGQDAAAFGRPLGRDIRRGEVSKLERNDKP